MRSWSWRVIDFHLKILRPSYSQLSAQLQYYILGFVYLPKSPCIANRHFVLSTTLLIFFKLCKVSRNISYFSWLHIFGLSAVLSKNNAIPSKMRLCMKNWSFFFIEGCIALKSVLKYLFNIESPRDYARCKIRLLKLFELNAVLFKDTKPMMMTYLIRQNLFGLTNKSAMFRSSWKSLRKLKLKFPAWA